MNKVTRAPLRTSLAGLAVFTLSLALPGTALPQNELNSARVVFEPFHIPQTDAEAQPLVPITALSRLKNRAEGVSGLTLADRREYEQDIDAYISAIGDMESEEGPYSDQLREDLFAAGQLAQNVGEHDTAIDFLTRAQNVSRINYGLETPDQIPIMQAMVTSYKAQDKLREADSVRQSILELIQKINGNRSIETIPAMLDYGVWNMDAFLERSNILLNIDRMNVSQFMADPLNYIDEGKSLQETPLFNLYQGQQTFLHAIDILIQNRQFFHPDIVNLERMLLKSYFLSVHRENIVYEPDFYLTRKKTKTGSRLNTNTIELLESEEYKLGNTSHDRIMAYISNNPAHTNVQIATAMLEAADWHLLFERKVKAAKDYQAVYDFYREFPEAQAELAPVLYPEFPVVLPVYLPAPNSREKLDMRPEDPIEYFGYFDVTYRIDKFGKAKKIKVIDRGGDVTRNMEIRLNQYLLNVLFRPMYRDGKLYTGDMAIRYYVGI